MQDTRIFWYGILIPGLITVGVAQMISNMPGITDIKLVIFLLLASIVNIALSVLVYHLYLIYTRIAQRLQDAVRQPLFLACLLLISLGNGVLLAAGYEGAWVNTGVRHVVGNTFEFTKDSQHSTLHRLLRELYNTPPDFPDYRNIHRKRDGSGKFKTDRILKVFLKDNGGAYSGFKGSWMNDGRVREIFLSPACRHKGASVTEVAGSGVFIRVEEISWIEVLDAENAHCVHTLRYKAATPAQP